MDEDSKLRKAWIFFWKVVALFLAFQGAVLLAALQSCLIGAVLPSFLQDVLPAIMVIAGIITVGAIVYLTAKALWGKPKT